jgi:hypothetical protein
MEAKGIKFDAAKYERKIALESLPEEVQKQAKEYVDRLAWTGRITGYTGWLADKTSNTFEAIKGDPIMPGDDTNTKAFKTFRNIVGTVIKLTTLPFSSVLFRGIQQIKNVVPFLGLFQRRMTLDENGKYVPTGTGLQYFELFREYRYYNASKNVYDTVRATNWEVFNRAAYSLLPGTLAFLLFQSMFTFGFDDEEEDKIYNELGFFSPDKFRMFLSGKGRFKADLTSNTLITGDYDTDMKSIMEGMGIQYEPNSVYRKTKDGSFAKVPIVGSYKDAPYGVFLSALAAVQERLLFAKEVAGGSKVVRDPLGPGEVFSIMALSGVGFLSEFGLSGALDQLKAVAGLLSGDAEEIGDINRALKKSAQTGVRQLVPGAAFASFWANLKGMYKDEDRRKGMGILESAIANTYVIEDFLDTYDYDALGKKLPYQESPYPVLGSLERAVASLNNDNYTLLTNSTFKDRQTYADQLRSRFLDLASTIRKQTPRDVAKTEMTVISEFDEKTKYQIGMDAGTYKAQMLEENAETLEKYWEAYQFGDLEEKVSSKGDYASTLNAVNNIGNDQAYCDRVLEMLENNADEIESNSGLVVSTVRDEITADSKLISNTILGDSKYYKKSKLIDLLYLNNLAIDKDGKIVYNKKYSEIYTDEAHDQYMISNQNEF